jgi:hypothetical protein
MSDDKKNISLNFKFKYGDTLIFNKDYLQFPKGMKCTYIMYAGASKQCKVRLKGNVFVHIPLSYLKSLHEHRKAIIQSIINNK